MPDSERIWVFESQIDGYHSEGAAAIALKRHAAELGQANGIVGSSYAIPTRDKDENALEWPNIEAAVKTLRDYATDNPNIPFKLSPGSAHTLVANDRYAKSRGYKHRIINLDTERYSDDAKQVLEMLSIAYATKLVWIKDPDGTSTSFQVAGIHLGACAGLEINSVTIH
mgnify:CR=1 FL=1|jgi:hypothetical protein